LLKKHVNDNRLQSISEQNGTKLENTVKLIKNQMLEDIANDVLHNIYGYSKTENYSLTLLTDQS